MIFYIIPNIFLYCNKNNIYLNSGPSGNAGGIAPLSQTVPVGDGVTLQANRFVLLGSKFIGWSTAKTTSNSTVVMYLPNQYIVPKGGMTLYPVWGPTSGTYLTVSYDANGGTGTPPPSQTIPAISPVDYGIRLQDNTFTNPGCIFLGWDEKRGSATADFSAGEIITPSDSLELYAIWGEGADIDLGTSVSSMMLNQNGSSMNFNVTSDLPSWTAEQTSNWMTIKFEGSNSIRLPGMITQRLSGAYDKVITVSALSNFGTTARTGTITITGGGATRTVTVTQNRSSGSIS